MQHTLAKPLDLRLLSSQTCRVMVTGERRAASLLTRKVPPRSLQPPCQHEILPSSRGLCGDQVKTDAFAAGPAGRRVGRVPAAGIELDGASDHGVSEAL